MGAVSADAVAADRSAAMLEGLARREWWDASLQYLDWAEKSPLVAAEFRQRIPVERASILAQQGRTSQSAPQRDRLLAEAAENLARFAVGDHLTHEQLAALRQAANLRAELALALRSDASRLPAESDAQRTKVLAEARQQFDAAEQLAATLVEQTAHDAAEPETSPADRAAVERRNLHAEGRYLGGLIAFERLSTLAPTSDEAADAQQAALKRFAELARDYPNTLVGLSSRFYEGRCRQTGRDWKGALACYEELLRLGVGDGQFRLWSTRAQRRRAECLIALEDFQEAIEGCRHLLGMARPEELERPEWLEVAYQLALADGALAAREETPAPLARQLESEARDMLRRVAAQPNEFQAAAKSSLAVAGRDTQRRDDAEPTTLAAALQAGRDALLECESLRQMSRLAEENNPEAVDDLRSQADEQLAHARRSFQAARQRLTADSADQDRCAVLYYLAYLAYDAGDFSEAAQAAEEVALRHPGDELALRSAQLALAALRRLATTADDTGAAEARRRLAAMAQQLAQQWPTAPEAAQAATELVAAALAAGRWEEAAEVAERLPPGMRSAARLAIAASQWERAQKKSADAQDALDRLDRAFAAWHQEGELTPHAVVGALYLAQARLARGDVVQAKAILDDPRVGPATLLADGSPLVERPPLRREVARTALQTYLLSAPPLADQRIHAFVGLLVAKTDDAEQSAADVAALRSVAGAVLQQFRTRGDAADPQARAAAPALHLILQELARRSDPGRWNDQAWLASAQLEVAATLDASQRQQTLEQIHDTLAKMLAQSAQQADFAPSPDAVLAVRMKLAEVLSELGRHDDARRQYEELLRQRPRDLSLQRLAALAWQTHGADADDAAVLLQSVTGAEPASEGQNLLWGWAKLAKVAQAQRTALPRLQADPQRRAELESRLADMFFQAHFQAALARLDAARRLGPAESQEQRRTVAGNIAALAALYPDLGGPAWQEKFAALRKQLQEQAAP